MFRSFRLCLASLALPGSNEGQSFFNSLPVDIRAKFNHNFAEFMAGMDKPDFLDKLGIKPERESDPSQEEKPAVEPKKEVTE